MPKSTAFAQDVVRLILLGEAIAGIADAAASPLANLYIALHTASPGAGSSQATSEATYTGYARQAVPRSSSGWTESGGVAALASNVDFPVCTGGGQTLTHWSIGTAASGAGLVLWSGALSSPIAVTADPALYPRILAGTSTVTET